MAGASDCYLNVLGKLQKWLYGAARPTFAAPCEVFGNFGNIWPV